MYEKVSCIAIWVGMQACKHWQTLLSFGLASSGRLEITGSLKRTGWEREDFHFLAVQIYVLRLWALSLWRLSSTLRQASSKPRSQHGWALAVLQLALSLRMSVKLTLRCSCGSLQDPVVHGPDTRKSAPGVSKFRS